MKKTICIILGITLLFATKTPVMGKLLESPDFLTDEQRGVYDKARELYFEYFAYGPTGFTGLDGAYDAPRGVFNSPKYGEYETLQATGEYAKWSDFMELLQAVFTDDCIRALVGTDHLVPMYICGEDDGYTYYLDGGVGSNIYNVGPDLYALTSREDDLVTFYIVGQYDYEDEYGIESVPFTNELIQTEDGWRVNVIAVTERGIVCGNPSEQGRFHYELYEEEGAASIEYISVTGLPDEDVQNTLNENIKDFYLWQWMYRAPDAEPDEKFYFGTAIYWNVIGGRYFSVGRFLDVYSEELGTEPESRMFHALTFDMETGCPVEDSLVYGGAAYTMANTLDKFYMVYPEGDDSAARSKLHDYMQSIEDVYSYYLTWMSVGVYFEDEDGYYRFEALYDEVGEILAQPLADAVGF